MHKDVLLQQIERRMVELGSPERKMRKKLEDFDLHYVFLKHTAIKEHLSEEAAETQAGIQLGNPVTLAEQAAAEVRQASWWGRHHILGFVVFPILSLGPALVAGIFLAFMVGLLGMKQSQWQDYFSGMRDGKTSWTEIRHLVGLLFDMHYLVLTIFCIPFTWMARRSGSGLLWATIPCLIFAAQGMFLQLHIGARGNPFHYYFETPNWLVAVGPFLSAGASALRYWQRVNRLTPLPEHLQKICAPSQLMALLNTNLGGGGDDKKPKASGAKASTDGPGWFARALKTPTYWVVAGALLLLMIWMVSAMHRQNDRVRVARARAAARQQTNQNNGNPAQ